jgi:hypothetical protein
MAGAMTLSTDPMPPPQEALFLAFDALFDEGNYLCSHGSGTAVSLGQTFTVPQATLLDKITLKVRPATAVAGELVTLRLGTFTDLEGEGMIEILAAETRALPATLMPGVTTYLTFDVEDLPLEANRQYGFLLGFTGGGNVNNARLELLHLGEDRYSEGWAVDFQGAFFSVLAHDLVFFLHGAAAVDDNALLLHEERFRIEAQWRTPQGQTGAGIPVPLTADSGTFWFFHPHNVELLVKVLDACIDPFQRFWFFAAGLTNVEVTLTVTDTLAGESQSYVNALGQAFLPIQDTTSFATCTP